MSGLKKEECGGERTKMCASSFPQTLEELDERIRDGQVVSHKSFGDSTIEKLCSGFDNVKNRGSTNQVSIYHMCGSGCGCGCVL